MPCEIASFNAGDKYDMTLFFINFYICLIIIISVLILANTIYNYYVYNNIITEKIYKDVAVIEKGEYPPKAGEVSSADNNILIGETVDYKLFISLLLDQNWYYNDKYFTLNITNILLDVFMLITIVLVILSLMYFSISKILKKFASVYRLNLDQGHLAKYIKQYCYFINNNGCDQYHMPKIVLIFIIFIILIAIYSLRRDLIPSIIYYKDYLDHKESQNEPDKDPRNIENMLNNIIGADDKGANKDNANINKLINKLNGHNIHTVHKVNADAEDSSITNFINEVKRISYIINKNKTDNKDLDFVKLVLVYLNNKKIYNDNNAIPGQITEMGRTYAQSLLNILTNVIPYSFFGSLKTGNYDIENILIGAIPLSNKDDVIAPGTNCSGDYKSTNELSKINVIKGCFYNNYVYELKEASQKDNKTKTLRYALLVILILSIISILFILTLFYYIYINYNDDNMKWAKMTAIKMMRLSWKNPLNWFSMLSGIIMYGLNNYN